MSVHLSALTQHISYSPLIFIFGLLVGIVLHIFVPLEFTNHTLRAIILGGILLGIAPLLLLWADQHRVHTKQGSEAGAGSHDLGSGPYRFSRHPKYVSFMFLFVGLGFIMNSVILFIIALALFLLFTFVLIPREEKILENLFPGQYEAYRKMVPMWL